MGIPRRRPFIPGAGPEQLQQQAAARAAGLIVGTGAQYNTLRRDPSARIITWDLQNPQLVGSPAALETQDAVVGNAGAHLPGRWPYPVPTDWPLS